MATARQNVQDLHFPCKPAIENDIPIIYEEINAAVNKEKTECALNHTLSLDLWPISQRRQ